LPAPSPSWGIKSSPSSDFGPSPRDDLYGSLKTYELQAASACINGENNSNDRLTNTENGPEDKVSGSFSVGYGLMLEDKLKAANNSNNSSTNNSRRSSSSNFAVESPRNETEIILESLGNWHRSSDNPNPDAFKVIRHSCSDYWFLKTTTT